MIVLVPPYMLLQETNQGLLKQRLAQKHSCQDTGPVSMLGLATNLTDFCSFLSFRFNLDSKNSHPCMLMCCLCSWRGLTKQVSKIFTRAEMSWKGASTQDFATITRVSGFSLSNILSFCSDMTVPQPTKQEILSHGLASSVWKNLYLT